MAIVPALKGLIITLNDSEADDIPFSWKVRAAGKSLYRIKSQGFEGFVAAGSVIIHEDELDYDQPSVLLPRQGL